ncbi:hypothetical protein [Micromonospora sp. NPDC001898]|uniref:hypothetical protein n=1 Tax=Micromonospora sp. NPDC001898 TaxID=3364221 RepID=UPI0036A97D29
METLVAYPLVVGGILMILLGATGVAAVISYLPVILGADAGMKLLSRFVSAPFLAVAVVMSVLIASSLPGPVRRR